MADDNAVYSMMAKIGLDATALMAGLTLFGLKLTSLTAQTEYLGIALKGLGSALAVVAIVKGFEDIAKAGGEVNHQLNMMKSNGMTSVETAAAITQAQKTALNVPTTNFSENLKHLQELRYIFGDSASANQYIDSLSRINDIIGNIKGGGKDQVFDLAKSLEMKNLTADPKEFMAYANAMLQTIQSSGGKITASMFRNAIQYGRVSALGWDKEFIGGALGRMIQEYSAGSGGGGGGGSGGPGNALMSMSAALIQGKMTKTSAAAWEELGFNNPKHGGLDQAHGRDLMMTNPYEWVQKFLMPALAEKGITDQNAIIGKIGELFGVRTAAGIVANMALGGSYHMPGLNAEGKPNSPFEKDIGLQKLAEGEGAYGRLIKEDYPMIMEAFNKQWKNMLEIIGGQLMAPGGPVIRAMSGLVEGFTTANKFFADHPDVINGLLVALAGLAAAFAAFAVTAVISVLTMLAPGGLIVVAILGLVGALGALAGLNWDKVQSVVDSLNKVGAIFRAIDEWSSIKIPPWMQWNSQPQKQSFQGEGSFGGARIIPANFNPGEKKQVLQPITIALNLDGRTLGQAVSEVLEDLYTHPTGPPQANGWDHFRPQGNYSDT